MWDGKSAMWEEPVQWNKNLCNVAGSFSDLARGRADIFIPNMTSGVCSDNAFCYCVFDERSPRVFCGNTHPVTLASK
jgi:hypothetical protein